MTPAGSVVAGASNLSLVAVELLDAFNNVAVAAMHARARWGIQRIAVVDFDVHHGNGTQAMFAEDPDLFYASSHQSPCYPGTGEAWEHGDDRSRSAGAMKIRRDENRAGSRGSREIGRYQER